MPKTKKANKPIFNNQINIWAYGNLFKRYCFEKTDHSYLPSEKILTILKEVKKYKKKYFLKNQKNRTQEEEEEEEEEEEWGHLKLSSKMLDEL